MHTNYQNRIRLVLSTLVGLAAMMILAMAVKASPPHPELAEKMASGKLSKPYTREFLFYKVRYFAHPLVLKEIDPRLFDARLN